MQVQWLRALVAFADEQSSITGAARRLHLTQPAVSHQLASLQRRAGRPLLRRAGRRRQLTPAGEELLRKARIALTALDDVSTGSAESGLPASGAGVRVGLCATGLDVLTAVAVAAFHQRFPEVALECTALDLAEACQHPLGAGRDVAIVRTPLPVDGLRIVPLRSENCVALLPAGHELADAETVPVEALLDEPFCPVSLGEPAVVADYWSAAHARGGGHPRWADLPAPRSVQDLMGAVRIGGAVCLAPASFAEQYRPPGVTSVAVTDMPASIIAAVVRVDEERDHVLGLVDVLLTHQ